MTDYQHILFRWAAIQGDLTSFILFCAGAFCAFYGFRFLRVILATFCGALGCFVGYYNADAIHLAPLPVSYGLGLILGIGALSRRETGIALAGAATFTALGAYLAHQLAVDPIVGFTMEGVGAAAGFFLVFTSRRVLPLIITSLIGTSLMLIGFVGLATSLLPSLGATFRSWANDHALLVPGLLCMLIATAYSVQSRSMQGDIRTGA